MGVGILSSDNWYGVGGGLFPAVAIFDSTGGGDWHDIPYPWATPVLTPWATLIDNGDMTTVAPFPGHDIQVWAPLAVCSGPRRDGTGYSDDGRTIWPHPETVTFDPRPHRMATQAKPRPVHHIPLMTGLGFCWAHLITPGPRLLNDN